MACPDLEELDGLANGELDEPTSSSLRAHLAACAPCSRRYAEVRANLDLVALVEGAVGPGPGMPERVGSYRVLRELGRGGMGVVYEVEQENPRRRVALKVLRGLPGHELERSLRREAQALARLDHPSIATIHEAGLTLAGEAFVAMELVEGRPLVAFAREEGLSHRRRLELFGELCAAIAHAHQRGVLHRDLKPSNVLVTRAGTPKVLDFGLAELLAPDEGSLVRSLDSGRVAGTIPYMSPEAVRGEPQACDVRSDVYSLGVVLYELLFGRLPYAVPRDLVAAARVISETPPVPPASLGRAGRGEVGTILLKALEKDPRRRYPSVPALAEDLGRHLAGLPILARTPTLGYQLSKLVARHRAFFGLATALLVGAIGVGIWMAVLYRRSAANLERALGEAALVRETNAFLSELLGSGDPHSTKGPDYTVRELLDEFSAGLPDSLAHQPLLRANLSGTLARAYRRLGLFDRAEPHLATALELSALDPDPARHADLLLEEAWLRHDESRYDVADAILEELVGSGDRATTVRALALHARADVARHRGDPGLAEECARAACGIWEARGERGGDWLAARSVLAQAVQDRGDLGAAGEIFEDALAHARRLRGDRHPTTATLLNNAAYSRKRRGDLPGAEAYYREALAIHVALQGEDSASVALVENNLGELLRARGDLEGAATFHEAALDRRRRILPAGHPDLAQSLNNLALVRTAFEDYAAAEVLYAEAVSIVDATLPEGHPLQARLRGNLARSMASAGRVADGEAVCRDALARYRELHPGDDLQTTGLFIALASVLVDGERWAEAEVPAREAYEMVARVSGPDTVDGWTALALLARIRQRLGRSEEAERDALAALAGFEATYGPEHPRAAEVRATLERVRADRVRAGDEREE